MSRNLDDTLSRDLGDTMPRDLGYTLSMDVDNTLSEDLGDIVRRPRILKQNGEAISPETNCVRDWIDVISCQPDAAGLTGHSHVGSSELSVQSYRALPAGELDEAAHTHSTLSKLSALHVESHAGNVHRGIGSLVKGLGSR
ncbi:hypothetical protein RRG08_043605 [Elysia crispata]|uniref:Uncharacterized protein n=1 Tax=Elysia crispata TaxID=231223 RepID=A0AAE1A665_9GAST|nr:hypothetical protein RRG08_043605 [Elysia crispata]